MGKFKPSGIRLRVWRLLREEQRAEALMHSGDLEKQRSVLQQLAAACPRQLPLPCPAAQPSARKDLPRLARSKQFALTGALEGWVVEKRCTANGRRYEMFISPAGRQFPSRVAAERSLGIAEG